jgi:hypothetical protein
MAGTRTPRRIPRFRFATLALAWVLVLLAARAGRPDQIILRGGGQIRGKVLPDPAHGDRVIVLTASGKTPLSFQKPQVQKVVPEPSALDEYVARRAEAAATAEAQFALGQWCEKQKLADLAELHYEAAVKQDKEFAPAHQKLGHVLYAGRWLSGDELREAQGLVKYKGKWMTPEERDGREARAARGAAQASWVRRIRTLRQAIAAGPEPRSRSAEQQLMEIREPVAVGPLVRVLGQDIDAFRMILDRVLGGIPGAEASNALVRRILDEPDAEVRQGTLTQLESRPEKSVVPGLSRALGSSNPAVVNRAAWALANLDAVSAVPRLIPALLTTQYRMVLVPSSSGSSGNSLASVTPGVPIFNNGSTVGLLTGPVVGPGVAAYGATSVPFLPYQGTSLSVGTASPARGPEPRLLAFTYQNVEVLAALVKLTGFDFGYDIPTWRRWLSTSFRPEAAPARRVPQP